MEKYKLMDFAKWARKEGISDRLLNAAVNEMSSGLTGDRLGSWIYKNGSVSAAEVNGEERGLLLYFEIRSWSYFCTDTTRTSLPILNPKNGRRFGFTLGIFSAFPAQKDWQKLRQAYLFH